MDNPSTFPVPFGRFWAKLHPRASPTEWHPLVAHSADVAAVLYRFLEPRSLLNQRLAGALGRNQLTPGERARLVFLAAVHDMGKTGHGFQTKGQPEGERGRYTPGQRGHVQTLLTSIDECRPLADLLDDELLPKVSADLDGVGWDLFLTTICHHGRPWEPRPNPANNKLWKPDGSGRDPLAEIQRLITHARRWSGLDEMSDDGFERVTPEFTHLFAGALTLADWIGSTQSAFAFAPWADEEPDRYWAHSQSCAARACARIGIVPTTCVVSLSGLPLLGELFPTVFKEAANTPTHLQRHIAGAMPLPGPGTRLLIESETGSGKTEAALILYARLRAAGLVGGLMFALPTRATASAMHRRVLEAITGMYIGDERPTVALAVGGQQPWTAANDDSVKEPPQTWPDPADRELANWSSSSSKKFMAAEVVIGTVDQVLLGGLPVKHAHLRLAALSRHLLVVDELHSYDRYMTEVLRRVLDLHTGAGGIALFMSATLSDAARTRYAATAARSPREQTYSHIDARELAYPSLAVCGAGEADWRFTQLESGSEPKVVRWSATGVTEALGMAVSAANEGARVLVLRNTVRAARETIRWLHDNGHNSLLWRPKDGSDLTPAYHSRYTLPDRLALDKAAGARFGKDAAAVTGGVILVSTQVAEQSLDVDFDLLISDLCPVDVLLQRIGRLHRHSVRNEHRPTGSRQAQAWVIAPEGGFAPFLKRKGMDLGWGEDRPYPNYADGELTLRLIQGLEWQEIVIPRDNRALIEAVYHGDPRKDLECDAEWDAYLIQAEGRESGRAWQGRTTALNFAHTYPDCAGQFTEAAEKHVYTRLGDQSVRIELNGDVRCWYSSPEQPVRHIDLPLWALAGIEVAGISEEPLPVNSGEHGTWFQLGARVFTYTQAGWEWEDA